MKEQVQFPFQIPKSGIKSMSDGGIRVSLDTPELDDADAARIFSYRGMQGWCILAPQAAPGPVEMPPMPQLAPSGQSPSQQLRSAIWRAWQNTSQQESFDEVYYPRVINALIEQVKETL